jgi:hypothetical protein
MIRGLLGTYVRICMSPSSVPYQGMVSEGTKTIPSWLPGVELLCALLAAALWYALPHIGPWPLTLSFAPWALRLALTGHVTRHTPFDWPLLLFLFSAGLGVWAAYDREAAWSRFWLIVGSVFIFYALANAESISGARLGLMALFGAGLTLYYLSTHDWQLFPAKIEAMTRLGRALQAPLPKLPDQRLNPNEVGGILAMLTPFAGWGALQAWQRIRHPSQRRILTRWLTAVAASGALALMLFGLLMTTSRGAWIALGSALLLTGSWLVAGWLSGGSRKRQARVFLGLLVLISSAGLGVAVWWSKGLATSSSVLLNPQTLLSRLEFQRNSLTLVQDYPFVGAGLGGFQMLYSTYVMLIHVGFIPHSHNLFLNVAIDQGLPGLLALVWMWILFGRLLYRGTLSLASAKGHWTPAASVAGMAALSLAIILIHGMVSNALYGKEGILLLFAPLAFAAPLLPRQKPQAERGKTWGLPLCIGLALGFVLVQWNKVASLVYSNLGAIHQSQAELSIYSWPEWPIQDAVRRQVDLGRPVSEFRQALALNPLNATANRRLGMIELSLGEYEDALRHLQAAFAAEPWCGTTQQLLGEALTVNGRVDEGQALWAGVDNAQQQFDLRAFWYGYIGDPEREAWVRRAANDR